MFERLGDRNLWAIYLATLVLGTAYGIAIASVGVYLTGLGFTKADVGLLATAFAGGVIIGAPLTATLVRPLGAKRVLTGALGLYALAITAFALVPPEGPWIAAARLLDGAASAGIWVSSEILLLARTRREVKGVAMSFYSLAVGLGYAIGPVVSDLLLVWLELRATYLVAGGVALCAALLVVLALRASEPERADCDPAQGAKPDAGAVGPAGTRSFGANPGGPAFTRPLRAIFWQIKTSCFASFAYGYFQASVVLFIPIWLTEARDVPPERTVLVTAWFAAGMLVFTQWFARIGDRVGHLSVMRALAVVGAVTVAGLRFVEDFHAICALVFIAGATFATTAPLSLAALGLMVQPTDYARANAAYNSFFALGMILGPPLSSLLFESLGGDAMFGHLALLWLVFALFTTVYRRDLPTRPHDAARGAGRSFDARPGDPTAPTRTPRSVAVAG